MTSVESVSVDSSLICFFVLGEDPSSSSGLLLEQDYARSEITEIKYVPVSSLGTSLNDEVKRASSKYVCFVHEGGQINADGMNELIDAISKTDDVDVFYTNESLGSGVSSLIAKPIYSPERLRNQFYLGDLVLYRRDLFLSEGGFNPGIPGAELYDLALRLTKAARAVSHIDVPVFHRAKPHTVILDDAGLQSTRRSLQSHLEKTGGGLVREVGVDGVHDTRRSVLGNPLVSIVIPSQGLFTGAGAGRMSYLLNAMRSIVSISTYENYEFVVVLDAGADSELIEQMKSIAGEKLHMVEFDLPFNFSDKINHGVVEASGEFILILNDDVRVLTPDWIEALLALAQRPNAGMSGAMLYYEDETIQHAGHAYYKSDASHIGLDEPRGSNGPLSGYRVEREVSGVTAACAMMPTDVYWEAGGLSSLLPGNFNDVDLCMKVTWLGYDIYWTPHAELYHYESKTRDPSVHAFEVNVAWGRWAFRMNDVRFWPYELTRTPHDRNASV